MTDVFIALLVGIIIVLIAPSVKRQQERLWGKGQKARIARARRLADDPASLVVWAITEAFIVGLAALFGLLLLLLPTSVAVIDIARGIPVDGFSLLMVMLMVLIGSPLVYLALRGGSQVLAMLESIKPTGPANQDHTNDES